MHKLQATLASGVVLALVAAGCGDSENLSPAAPSPIQPAPAMALAPGAPQGLAAGGALGGLHALDPAVDASHGPDADGVTLKATAPEPASPVGDEETSDVRVTLAVENARPEFVDVLVPFTYRFELYADGGGMTPIDEGTAEQGAGTTSYDVPLSLENDVRYRWRARAEYEGHAGPWSEEAAFRTPAARIGTPVPTDPSDGATDVWPVVLRVTNGETSGRVGPVVMTFEVSKDPGFGSLVVTVDQPAGPGNTSVLLSAGLLEPETTYYWRVIARDDRGHASEYSHTFQFTTARAGGSGADEIDVSQVTWLHSNVSRWPTASTITDVRIRDVPAGGICIEHTKARSWPGISISGTVLAGNPWVFAQIGGRWYAGTYEWNRPGQICKLTVSGKHDRPSRELGPHVKRPPMTNWVPRSGETVGFMVSTPARFGPDGPVRERSNIVLVTWP